jgi:hypothetical protein
MLSMVNPNLVFQTLDSGSLTILGRVAHPAPKAGTYVGTLWQGSQAAAYFHLVSDPSNTLPQTNIDLASLVPGAPGGCPNCPPGSSQPQFSVNPQGYLVFYVSHGTGGFAVTLTDTSSPSTPVFDSRQLQAGDCYVVNVLGAGQYNVTNTVTQQTHSLVVNLPPASPTPQKYIPPAPVQIQVQVKGFDQAAVQVMALQAKVYMIQAPSRIQIVPAAAAPAAAPAKKP